MRRNFRTVVSLDESRFTLKFADGSIRVWRRPAESCTEACVMSVDRFGDGSLMVWGGVNYARKTNLIVIRQTLNAQRYCDDKTSALSWCRSCAETIVLSFSRTMIGPTPLDYSMNCLQANNVNTLPLPSRSPGLTPIEHGWDILNREASSSVNSLQVLENAVIIEWNAIPPCQDQNNHAKRCRATITANGAWTIY